MDEWVYGAIGSLALALAFSFGWITSASTISQECKSLGAFYVGHSVFACKPKPAGEGEK